MSKQFSQILSLENGLKNIQRRVADSTTSSDFRESAILFTQFSDSANEGARNDLARGGETLARVLELAACWNSEHADDPQSVERLVGFVKDALLALQTAVHAPATATAGIDEFIQFANDQWSDYLDLMGDRNWENQNWDAPQDEPSNSFHSNDELENTNPVANSQFEMLLSAVTGGTTPLGFNSENKQDKTRTADSLDAPCFDLANDHELLEAYLDDAQRCLSSMEQAALQIESEANSTAAIESTRQFCRELHTLKGASATVGLTELAAFLHELESSLDDSFSKETDCVDPDPLFDAVDRVRLEIEKLQPADVPSLATKQPNSPTDSRSRSGKSDVNRFANNDDSSIRIRAAKLDRLMDMLAELVVLRNRRESHIVEFNALNDELNKCATRLVFAEEQLDFGGETESQLRSGGVASSSCTFAEVAKDICAVSHGMRELQKPVANDNHAISRFIRDFRQELMQLRRIPVSGLFNRLQRAARDAAKSEHKQVQIEIVGSHAGLEQEIQERLYESLLHIVRNSVSHGIESEKNRIKAGKDPVGTVTLEAFSSAQLLVIEVRDDGNGLDYAAVKRRGIEKGLLAPNQTPTNDELSSLIFHPGFSTREQASEISGRGVGMDVVATTIEQLRGRIEVVSVAGQGTTIRLLIPLRSGIEHVMVFRCDGQLFALPLQSVTAAKASNASIGHISNLSLKSTSSLSNKSPHQSDDVLILRSANDLRKGGNQSISRSPNAHFALAVDQLVGPEEVVVRGIPNLLKRHPLFCGVTLSGSSETVLLLDSESVVEFCRHQSGQLQSSEGDGDTNPKVKSPNQKRALIVDDSMTARRLLSKLLQQHDFDTVEVGDGIEAIEQLHRKHFDIVLTDLDMPRLGGMELLSDLHSGQFCHAPVVVVSSRDEAAFRTKALDLGASDYITKPVSEKSITQLLENLQLLVVTSKG